LVNANYLYEESSYQGLFNQKTGAGCTIKYGFKTSAVGGVNQE